MDRISHRRAWQFFLRLLFPWRRRNKPYMRRRQSVRLGVDVLEDRLAPAVFNVPGDAADLGSALALVSASTDTDNTIKLGAGTFQAINLQIAVPAGSALTIMGQGQGSTVLTADQQGRVLQLAGPGAITLDGLTITGGLVQGSPTGNVLSEGGGILMTSGDVTLNNVAVKANTVLGFSAPATAGVNGAGGDASGGGIYVADGDLTLTDSMISANKVQGGNGYFSAQSVSLGGLSDGSGYGGGLYVASGTLDASGTTFDQNVALSGNDNRNLTTGASGASGGVGAGGGLDVAGGTASGEGLIIANNQASGFISEGGGFAVQGGAVANLFGATVTNNQALGLDGDVKGAAGGGGCVAGTLSLVNPTFSGDIAQGASNKPAYGGGLYVGNVLAFGAAGQLSIYGGTFSQCVAHGGDGQTVEINVGSFPAAEGGPAYGGAIFNSGHAAIFNATISDDSAIGGNGGAGPAGGYLDVGHFGDGVGGDAQGGGISNLGGTLNLVNTNVVSDSAQGGNGGDCPTGSNGLNGLVPTQAEIEQGGIASGFLQGHIFYKEASGGGGGSGNTSTGGDGGAGWGGALSSETYSDTPASFLVISGGSFSGSAHGGKGGNAGAGGSGGSGVSFSYDGKLLPEFSQLSPGGRGGDSIGGEGGPALGGGVYLDVTSPQTITGASISGSVQPGAGGSSGGAGAGGNDGYFVDFTDQQTYKIPSGPGQNTAGSAGFQGDSGLDNSSGQAIGATLPAATHLVFSPIPPEVNGQTPFTYPVYVVAEDAAGIAGDYNGNVTVSLQPLTLGTLSATAWDQNDPGYAGTIQVSGGTMPYQVSIQGLPAGLNYSLDPNSGLITIAGTPTQAGNSSITVTVTDPAGDSVVQTYALTINPPLALGTLSPTEWSLNEPGYEGAIQVSGGALPYSADSLQVSGLPSGLSVSSFNTSTGLITIAGTPTGATPSLGPGNFTANLLAPDSSGTGSNTVSGTGSSTVTGTTSTVTGTTSTATGTGSSTVTGTGTGVGTGTGTGVGIGTGPGTGNGGSPSGPVTYTVGVTVSDGLGASVTGAYALVIDPSSSTALSVSPNNGPIIHAAAHPAGPSATEAKTTNSAPPLVPGSLSTTEWAVNQPGYEGSVQLGTGATYRAVTVVGLPAGLRSVFNQTSDLLTITGTPTQAGAYSITVTAIQGTTGARTTDTFSLVIDAPLLTGTLTVQAVHGVAVFTNLSVNKAGDGYTLIATSSNELPAAPSNPFTVNGSISVTTTVTPDGQAIDYTSVAVGLGKSVSYQVALYASPDEQFHPSDVLLATQTVQGNLVNGVFQLATGPASLNDINPNDPYLLVVANPSALLPARQPTAAPAVAGTSAPAVASAVTPADVPEPPGPVVTDTSQEVAPAAIYTEFVQSTDPDDPIGMLAPGNPAPSTADPDGTWSNFIDQEIVPKWEGIKDTTVTVFQAGKNAVTGVVPFLYSVEVAALENFEANFHVYYNNPDKGVASLQFMRQFLDHAIESTEQMLYTPVNGVKTLFTDPKLAAQSLLYLFGVAGQGVQWTADAPLSSHAQLIDSLGKQINTPQGLFDYVVSPLLLPALQEAGMNLLSTGITNLKGVIPTSQLAATFRSQLGTVVSQVETAALATVATTEPELLAQISAMSAAQKVKLALSAVTGSNTLADTLISTYNQTTGLFSKGLALQELAAPQLTRSFKRLAAGTIDYVQALIDTRQQLLYNPANQLTVKAVQGNQEFVAWAASEGLDTSANITNGRYNLQMGTVSTPGKAATLGADRDAVLYVVNSVTGDGIEVPAQFWVNQAYSDFYKVGLQALGGSLPSNLQPYYNAWVGWLQKSTSLTAAQVNARAFANLFNQLFTTAYDVEASRAFSNQVSWAFDPTFVENVGFPVPLPLAVSNIELVQAGKALLQDPVGFMQMWRAKVDFYFNPVRTGQVLVNGTTVDLGILNNYYLPEAIAQAQKGIESITAVREGYLELQQKYGVAVVGKIPNLPPQVTKAMSIIAQAPVGIDATAEAMSAFNSQLQSIGYSNLSQAWDAISGQLEFLKGQPPGRNIIPIGPGG